VDRSGQTAPTRVHQASDGLRRATGIAVGLGNQAIFLITVWYLFWFLKGEPVQRGAGSLWMDLWLAAQFCVPHSILLLPGVRTRWERWIPAPFYGTFYCLVTCGALWGMFANWNVSPYVVWQFQGWGATAVQMAFYGSWVSLFYSLRLTGMGYQTGWTPWWHWFRRQPQPRREFNPRSLYLWLRHPVYASFLGLLWFTPTVTLDRALLIGLWSAYIFLGSYLKDQRLEFFLKDRYRLYAQLVPGYPGIWFGPLARYGLQVEKVAKNASQAAMCLTPRLGEPSAEKRDQAA